MEQTSKSEGVITNSENFELENQKEEKSIESSDSAHNEIQRKKDELNIGLKTENFDEKLLTNEESSAEVIDNQTSKSERRKSSRRSISDKKTTSYDNNQLVKDNIEKEKSSNEVLATDLEEQRRPLLVRRNTVVEEAEESLRQARKSIALENNRKNSVKESWVELKKEIYNPQYREFMSRDCLAWFKLSLCYFIFYFLLASFFVMLLALYYTFKIDTKTPNLFYKESVMHYKGINPGLGFRPQVDVETELIKVNANESKNNFQSIDLFLAKYDQNKLKNFTGAHGRKQTYNYEDYIKDTPCSRENHFGFDSQAPCIIVKLNRIYGWLPTASAKAPGNLTKVSILLFVTIILRKNSCYIK